MNLFYEDFPNTIPVHGKSVRIVTDFIEYIKLLDLLKDDAVLIEDKISIISEYFLDDVFIDGECMKSLENFILLKDVGNVGVKGMREGEQEEADSKPCFSFSLDFPCIYSAFLREYGIDIKKSHMHWWKFRMLFDNLSDDSEIKQRIMYRSVNLSTVKDKDERERIRKIQNSIMLPDAMLTDFEIGSVFE